MKKNARIHAGCDLRFAIIGDTHFCTDAICGAMRPAGALSAVPDFVRYTTMVDDVLAPLFERIRLRAPDLVISTGDFVEGGMPADREKTWQEMREGWAFLGRLGSPCLIAKGTHEGAGDHPGAQAYREIVLPGMSTALKKELDTEYFRHDVAGCSFLLLDYLAWHPGNQQDLWLEAQLADASETAAHIFVVAHPPIYPWGRPFFNEPLLDGRLAALCKRYPIDAYLCGHTHNQAVSTHSGASGTFMQIMCSSVGYPQMGIADLREMHAIEERSGHDRCLWGVIEDSAPGFYLIELQGESLHLEWHTVDGLAAELSIRKRRGPVETLRGPVCRPCSRNLLPKDLHQIKAAWLHGYGAYQHQDTSAVSMNGVALGPLPVNTSYAARRFLPLTMEALRSLGHTNTASIRLPKCEDILLGSISLEVLLHDGRVHRSVVAPEIFLCGKRWDGYERPRMTVAVHPGQAIEVDTSFA